MYPFIENVGKTYGILPAWLLMFLVVFLRYAVLASVFYAIFYGLFRQHFFKYKIQQKYPHAQDLLREVGYSLSTAAIFASMAFGVYALRQLGLGRLYFQIAEYGWGYYFFSIAFVVVLHDAYFYWVHRLMHHPRLFRHFHRVHHLSHNPSPYTAFSFHPLEAIVEFGIIPLVALFMPLHGTALLFFTVWSIFFNVFGHTGFEFAPHGAPRHHFWKWLSTPTHHNLHHQQANYNFSLYFNWWDRWMGTNNPRYEEVFDRVKKRGQQVGVWVGLCLLATAAAAQPSSNTKLADQYIQGIQKGQYQTPAERCQTLDTLMKTGLGLRTEQMPSIHQLNLQYAQRTEYEVVRTDETTWSKFMKIKKIQKEKDAALRPLLDAAQFEKYTSLRDAWMWNAIRQIIF